MAQYKELARSGKVAVARNEGDAAGALAGAAKVLEAEFEFPYLAHAAMEPLDAVARFENGTLEIWAGHQMPDLYQAVGAQIMGIDPAEVKLHVMTPGGFFGRRAVPDADVIVEVVSVLKATGAKAPVKVLWTREDDMKGGRYRPMYYHTMKAGLDAAGQSGRLAAPDRRAVDPGGHAVREHDGQEQRRSDLGRGRLEPALRRAQPAGRPRDHRRQGAGPLVALGRLDPHGLLDRGVHRRAGAGRGQRSGRVPPHAAARPSASPGRPEPRRPRRPAGARPSPEGRFRGVAVHESFNTYVAQVAEISLRADGSIKVERVVCAVDCGIPVNPDIIKAQMEGGIGFGLGAILKGEITLDGGRVEQANFDTYRMLTIDEMPRGRGAHRAVDRVADRRRRARRAADRSGGRERSPCRDRQADPGPAVQPARCPDDLVKPGPVAPAAGLSSWVWQSLGGGLREDRYRPGTPGHDHWRLSWADQ